MKYDNNITLVKQVSKAEPLQDDEYYVLMVTDTWRHNDSRFFFNKTKGWLGLEKTSGSRIYISKDFAKRRTPLRGDTFVAKVENIALCYDLS